MSAAFLCVQFRNVLPSEELLRRARSHWNELQRTTGYTADGDATLSIRQSDRDDGRFEVELTVPGAVLSASALDKDALAGIARVFRDVAAAHASESLAPTGTGSALSPQLVEKRHVARRRVGS